LEDKAMKRTGNFLATAALAAACLATVTSTAFARAGYRQVASPGQPVAPQPGWPEGAIELVNDEARTVGWNFFFSELPNGLDHYALAAKSTDDLNRLIEKLAAIKAKGASVQLAPGREYPTGGFSFLKLGNGIPAVLALGNQERLNQWYSRLEEIEPGVRKFGVHQYTEPPTALPPTLTIYVEHPVVDLSKLVIPEGITTRKVEPAPQQRTPESDAALKAIDDFLETRQAKSQP
jgi:hypothetical protein